VATRVRLDRELVRRGLAPSREAAGAAIRAGRVLVGGAVAAKASTLVSTADPVALAGPARRWASRGGDKLAPALERLRVPVAGRRCLDAGASTGGFTDVLLQAGAAEVVAVDVGYGQLDQRLRQDPRVRVLDRTNVRAPGRRAGRRAGRADRGRPLVHLAAPGPARPGPPDPGRRRPGAAGQAPVRGRPGGGGPRRGGARPRRPGGRRPRGGRGRRPLGLGVAGVCPSPLPGPAGNLEVFLHLRAGAAPLDEADLQAALAVGATLPGAAT
jgi:23S rRNA (cytidine1920-2'-O)/16S rRNA (cytidine1409-2'-O)-methyltransferase